MAKLDPYIQIAREAKLPLAALQAKIQHEAEVLAHQARRTWLYPNPYQGSFLDRNGRFQGERECLREQLADYWQMGLRDNEARRRYALETKP